MKTAEQVANKGSNNNKLKDYLQLMKPSLSIMVVFSSVICYLLAPKVVEFDWIMILLLFVGGMLVTGSANTINQVVERETDAIMKRTASRPVASGRMSVEEGWAFAVITGLVGVFILGYYFNWLSAGLAAFSLFLYAFVYTPLKRVNAIASLAGQPVKMNYQLEVGYYLQFSFYGNSHISGPLPGWHIMITAVLDSSCYQVIKVQQNGQHCKP